MIFSILKYVLCHESKPIMSVFDALADRETAGVSGDKKYKVVNKYGFTGKYQVGEALLHDLGYFDSCDGRYYTYGDVSKNRKPKNTWQGTWKKGLRNYNDLLNNTNEIQETIIREAFRHNEGIIEKELDSSLDSAGEKYGRGQNYTRGGILTGAHLCGPYAVIKYFKDGSIAKDENKTLITDYMQEFSRYSYP